MLGHQLAVDLFDCDPVVLDDLNKMKDIIATTVGYLNADIIQVLAHRFSPQGTSCVALISASHVAIHTWPESRFASVDIFSCGLRINTIPIVEMLKHVLSASRAVCCEAYRGEELHSPFFREE